MTPLEPIAPLAAPTSIEAPPPIVEPEGPAKPSRPASRRGYAIGIGACVLIAAILLIKGARHATEPASGRLPVSAVAKVTREDLRQTVTIAAEFRPFQQVALHAKIAGYLQSISVDVGDHVKEGQTLAQLDVPELKDDMEKATASLRASEQEVIRAQANYNDVHSSCARLQDVAKEHPKFVAQQELDTVQAKDATAAGALAAAKQHVGECTAELNKVHSMIAYTTITAPFDGVITRRNADPGALIQAGTSSSAQLPVVDIAEDKHLRLVFPVPESAVALVKIGAPLRVTVSSIGLTMDAKVWRYAGKVDRSTRTMSTEAEIDNSDGRLTPGMYASVSLVIRECQDAVTVPVQAIAVGEKPKVFVVTPDGTVEEREVKLGLETPSKAQVISGVAQGEMVIIGSRSGVQPGQKVSPKLIEIAATE